MQMPKFILKRIRQRKCDQVVRVGRERADLIAQRRQLDGTLEHTQVDAAYLDRRIEQLSRKRDSLIAYLKHTPAY